MGAITARHAQLSKEQLDEILRNTDSRNTKIATNSAVATFQSYLNSAFGYDPISMQSFTPATLDSALTTFYAEVRMVRQLCSV
jgi:hypothetical protein